MVTNEVLSFKSDFPLLKDRPLVYLDSGATTQKPEVVIQAMDHYYREQNANVHRGIYSLSEKATILYEATRQKVKKFIHAEKEQEIIFTRGTTESINLVASSFGQLNIQGGDEIIISGMEHHSNIVPWQLLCERTGAVLKVIPVEADGTLNLDTYLSLFSDKTKLVGIVHISNVLGTVNPIRSMIQMAHEKGVPVLVDGAQAVAHTPVDVQALDCDFYVFSGHKLYGPTGIGVLYGKSRWLAAMPPYQGGGNMISRVSFEKTTYQEFPYKFEAGTPNVAGVVGLSAAIDYVKSIGWDFILSHEAELLQYATKKLSTLPGIKIFGQAREKAAVIAFGMQQAHPHDIGTILDHSGVAIRAGHHCAMPLMERFQVPAMSRISFGVYNELSDIDRLCEGLKTVIKLFG